MSNRETIQELLKAIDRGEPHLVDVISVTQKKGFVQLRMENPDRNVVVTSEVYDRIKEHIHELDPERRYQLEPEDTYTPDPELSAKRKRSGGQGGIWFQDDQAGRIRRQSDNTRSNETASERPRGERKNARNPQTDQKSAGTSRHEDRAQRRGNTPEGGKKQGKDQDRSREKSKRAVGEAASTGTQKQGNRQETGKQKQGGSQDKALARNASRQGARPRESRRHFQQHTQNTGA